MNHARNGHSFAYYLSLPFVWIGKGLKALFRPTSRGKLRWGIFAVLLLAALSAFTAHPRTWNVAADAYNARVVDALHLPGGFRLPHYWDVPFRLGLDLQGGTHLVYEADTNAIPDSERADAMEGVRDVIERRVNAFGVAEPIVQTNRAGDRWRIIVELAGVRDVRDAIRMIGETPILEFKEENAVTDIPLTAEQQKELDKKTADAKEKAQATLSRSLAAGADFAALAKEVSDDTVTKDAGGALGPITESGPYGELWKWIEAHPGTRQARTLVEAEGGWNILRVNGRDESAKEVRASHILICYKDAAGCGEDLTKEEALAQITELRASLTPENFAERAKANSLDPSAASNGGDLGWFGAGAMVKPFEDAAFAMRKGEISQPIETAFGWHVLYKADERPLVTYNVDRIFVRKPVASDVAPPVDPWKNTGLSGKHVRRAQIEFDQTSGMPQVALQFNDEGRELFSEITGRSVGKPIAIYLDGQPISIPNVQQAITDGNAVISGSFDFQEAKLLAQRLNAGALPVPITLLSQQTVGASLGQDSLQKSLYAGLVGFLLVVIFMVLYYRLPGLLAALALVMYTAFSLAIFKLWGVTLTLSGIAGVILSIGMAVDANILIFERMKEELKAGRPLDSSVTEGFHRAWTSIRDSNVSSLITCGILYSFTSSSVRGFAVTLAIGIIISMFSAITVTRTLLRLVAPWTAKFRWLYV